MRVKLAFLATLETKEGRQAHARGQIAEALHHASGDLLAAEPAMTPVDVNAVK